MHLNSGELQDLKTAVLECPVDPAGYRVMASCTE